METDELAVILVVDDERKMVKMVSDYLEAVGYRVLTAENGKEAISAVQQEAPDLVVLDVMMPGLDGVDTARRMRRESRVPIIMLTAKAEEQDKLLGLDAGADDYVTKPFSLKELAARIRAVLRRSAGAASHSSAPEETGPEEVITCGDLRIDRSRRLVYRNGARIELTGAQFELLAHMAAHSGRVYTRMQLLELLQDHAFEGYERTIDVHIKNLRKSIERDSAHPEYIHTVWGVGYKVEEPLVEGNNGE
jgi:DNA-binding response OmpR family regulator